MPWKGFSYSKQHMELQFNSANEVNLPAKVGVARITPLSGMGFLSYDHYFC